MPRISKYKLDKNIEKDVLDNFDLVLSRLKEKDDVSAFLNSFLTPTERLMLAKRLSIAIMINEKIPQSQIARALNMSRLTVARMELLLEARGEGYKSVFEILKNDKALKDLKDMLIKLAAYTARSAGGRVKPSIF